MPFLVARRAPEELFGGGRSDHLLDSTRIRHHRGGSAVLKVGLRHPGLTGQRRRLWAGATAVSALGGLVLARERWRQVHCRLLDMEVQAETAEVRERLRVVAADAYRHELINAYTAIEGAAMILEQETLEAERSQLHEMLASEIGHLRDLLDPGRGPLERVSLADAAAELAREPEWHDRLELDVAPDLVATGLPGQTKEAVRQVLGYVSRRAPAGPVTVRGQRADEWVGLWVDGGRRVLSRRQRRAMFDLTGDRLGPDFPMALHVAARLMRGQDGDLRVEARAGGVLSFGACLPTAPDDRRKTAGPHA